MDGVAEPVGGDVGVPVGPPGGFKKGEDSRRHVLPTSPKAKSVPAQEYVAPDPTAPEALQDMQHVYRNKKVHDKTLGQEETRRYKEDYPKEFRDQMMKAEREHQASKKAVSAGGEDGEDVGTEKCIEASERLMGELSEKAKGEPK